VSEPGDSQYSVPIVEIHSILLPYCDLRFEASISTSEVLCTHIRSVPPSTHLFQPPVEKIFIRQPTKPFWVRKEGGVTFGTLHEELARQKREAGFFLEVYGGALDAAAGVKIARTAEILGRLYADREHMRPDVFKSNISRAWKGHPWVDVAEFERVKTVERFSRATP
jgi:hypothetical protein